MPKSINPKNQDYIKQKADEIEKVLVKGMVLTYNPNVPIDANTDIKFRSNFQSIVMELKDRNFKIWGKIYPNPGNWNICK